MQLISMIIGDFFQLNYGQRTLEAPCQNLVKSVGIFVSLGQNDNGFILQFATFFYLLSIGKELMFIEIDANTCSILEIVGKLL